ncbi:MAG: DUF1073 domain-containing protein [Myxococcales bacterium FL481]|nr:MAG: DUF1073 domain-containing protein [Myxococcales bacterium FL481]
METPKKAQTFVDAYSNSLEGRGMEGRDLTRYDRPAELKNFTLRQLERAYNGGGLHARVVDIFPEEALRNGFTFTVDGDEELGQQVYDYMETRGMFTALADALVHSRIYGGTALLLGTTDTDLRKQPGEVASVRWARSLGGGVQPDRDSVDTDLLSPTFGQPKFVTMRRTDGTTTEIDARRVVLLRGEPRAGARPHELGVSSIERHWDSVSALETVVGSMAKMAREGATKNLEIDELDDIIEADEGKTAIQNRARNLEYGAGAYNVLITQKGKEALQFIAPDLKGFPANIDKLVEQVCASVGAPVTVLFGQSVGGLGTGADENRRWRDRVRSYQTKTVEPAIRAMFEICSRAADFPAHGVDPLSFSVTSAPLDVESGQDRAETGRRWAEVATELFEAGLANEDEAKAILARGGLL